MRLKRLVALCMVGAMALSFAGCSKNEKNNAKTNGNTTETTNKTEDSTSTDTTAQPAEDSSNLSGTVVITGSTSVDKILNDMIDEFQAINPDVTINYTGTGSSAGIADTIAGSNDLGASSRELKDEEKADNVKEVVFAHDGIAVITNPANTVTDISVENLAKIYSGEITNWNQLGGNDAPIVIVSREGASGTRSAFEELIKLEDAGGLTEDAMVVEGNGNVQTSVAGNENAIGYVSFSFIDDTVKALTVESVEATAENAKAGSYPLSRPFLFVYDENNYTAQTKAFVEFALSEDGQSYVEAHGGIKID
ncbi:phosphate transport system substrate-binding protein [Anaerosporobacter mobilis DSM 15930]|uniref:Phosphate-binding protein n=1 Tax=Anaerosporobacter mobilis DSM 15930 TaxID=1120996 RepID=A0A1M7JT61_9FIRM|nr:phosphate ABC transporter substrate-binding protein [Anaerosporobacter mobilis]SHM56290.1 phosphate transport system substrate-binding protein [Anaerosporobacter mobilis DSM 15930]